jgi:hypothetical protein
MSKTWKLMIPVLILAIVMAAGVGFGLSQSTAVSAAGPSTANQGQNSAFYCDPDNCPAISSGICPGANSGNCPGRAIDGGTSRGCPCGGRGFAQ